MSLKKCITEEQQEQQRRAQRAAPRTINQQSKGAAMKSSPNRVTQIQNLKREWSRLADKRDFLRTFAADGPTIARIERRMIQVCDQIDRLDTRKR